MEFSRNEEILICRPALLKIVADLLRYLAPLFLLRTAIFIIFSPLLNAIPFLFNLFTWSYRLICLILIAESARRYFNQVLILGHTRVLLLQGLLSWKSLRVSVRYNDIREIHVTQSLIGRALAYGDLYIGSAAKNDYEIEVFSLPFPHRLGQLIDDLRRCAEEPNSTSELNPVRIDIEERQNIVPQVAPDEGPAMHAID